MKNSIAALLGSVLVMAAGAAQAQTDTEADVITTKKDPLNSVWFTADANLGLFQFSDTQGNTTFVSDNFTAGHVRAGVKYKYFGVEGEYGFGLSGIEEGGVEVDLENQTAIFGVLRYPSDNGEFWLRAGYHTTDFEVSAGQLAGTVDSDGFAFGIGGAWYFADNFGLRADITGYNTRDIADAGFVGGSLGVTARF